MKQKLLLSIFIYAIFCSCNYKAIDGPNIRFADILEWQDTIEEDSKIFVQLEAFAGKHAIAKASIYNKKEIIFDTIFSEKYSEVFLSFEPSFINKTGLRDIKIEVTDEKELTASQTKQIYVQRLYAPSLTVLRSGIYSDTTISVNSSNKVVVRVIKTDRDLDSLFLNQNDSTLQAVKVPNEKDTVDITMPYTPKSTGKFLLQTKVVDVIGKTTYRTQTITVE